MLHRPVQDFETSTRFTFKPCERDVRLAPPTALARATASIDQALAELRDVEALLELQLQDLRSYMSASTLVPATSHAPAVV